MCLIVGWPRKAREQFYVGTSSQWRKTGYCSHCVLDDAAIGDCQSIEQRIEFLLVSREAANAKFEQIGRLFVMKVRRLAGFLAHLRPGPSVERQARFDVRPRLRP